MEMIYVYDFTLTKGMKKREETIENIQCGEFYRIGICVLGM